MSKNTTIDKKTDVKPKSEEAEAPVVEREAYENPLVSVADDGNLPALSNPALHRYLQEISQYELLSREETDELAIRFREEGDQDAAYRLVSSNLRLVVKVAMDFQKYYGKRGPYKIVFDREQAEDGFEVVARGSYLLKMMASYLDKSGETTLLKINFNVNPEDELLKRVVLENCKNTAGA